MKIMLFALCTSLLLFTSCVDTSNEVEQEGVSTSHSSSSVNANLSSSTPDKIYTDKKELEQFKEKYFEIPSACAIVSYSWKNAEEIKPAHLASFYYFSKLVNEYKGDSDPQYISVPSQQLEIFVQQFFTVSPYYIREASAYDEETGTYKFLNGVGSSASSSITKAEQRGNLLHLSFEQYSPSDDETVIRYGVLVVQIEGENYKYISCESTNVPD